MQKDSMLSKEPEDQEKLAERLQQFGGRLSRLASEQTKSKQRIEQRWLQDFRQYHGEYSPDILANIKASGGSQMSANITRNKSNAAEARLSDMLFPTDDRNWGIRPTPVPTLAIQEAAIKEDKAAIEKESKVKAENMQQEIDDQLNESRYSSKARDIIHDSIQLGSGVIKGPVIVGRTNKQWRTLENGMSELTIVEGLEPSVERVNPWNFFPDMSASCVEECEFFFERHLWTKKQLRTFSRLPGVITNQLRELVKSGAQGEKVAQDYTDDIREITGVDVISNASKFEVWEYHGPINKDEYLNAIKGADEAIEKEEVDELNNELDAVVFFSGNKILKVVINAMDTEEHPYSVFCWEKDEGCVFGFSVPYLMRNAQSMIDASIRMMMDNAGASVSDIIVANREIITPADGVWSSAPGKKKLYYLTDQKARISDAFGAFSVPNQQAALERVFSLARQLADEETNLPLIAQGEQSANVTKTSSGMSMLMNSANIVLRRAVKNWDDDITRPLISRFYDWNMQFSDNNLIKGDFKVDARGSGALLAKEKQQQNLMIYANLSGSNQELALMRDWEGLDKEIAKSLEVPHDKITLSKDEIDKRKGEMSQPKQDIASQIKAKELEIKAQEFGLKQQEANSKRQLEQQKISIDAQFKQQQLQQDRELAIAKIAAQENLTIQQLAAKINIEMTRNKTARDTAAANIANKQTETQLKAVNMEAGFDSFA